MNYDNSVEGQNANRVSIPTISYSNALSYFDYTVPYSKLTAQLYLFFG